jgi:hypothetical protein
VPEKREDVAHGAHSKRRQARHEQLLAVTAAAAGAGVGFSDAERFALAV